ncbi:MAG: hypothetical protein AAF437_08840 [Pseudomonadota bacterium]
MRSRYETPFAILTLTAALLHFAGESYYHVIYGQPLPSYVVDLIAIGLMLLASGSSLLRRDISSAGWIAAGWGFTLCLNYRSYFGRVYQKQSGDAIDEPSIVLTILGVTLVTNAIAFLIAMWLARPKPHS